MARRRRSERYDVRKTCWHCGIGRMLPVDNISGIADAATAHLAPQDGRTETTLYRCSYCGANISASRFHELDIIVGVKSNRSTHSGHSSREHGQVTQDKGELKW